MTVLHVADRAGDLYDWLAAERPAHAHLLVRVAQTQRVVVQGPDGVTGPLAEVVAAAPVLGRHTLPIRRADDRPARDAVLTVRLVAVGLPPPRNAKGRSGRPTVPVRVVEAVEQTPPAGCPAVCWRLVTTEPVAPWEEALRVLREYAWRWLSERLHWVLKSGCRVEQLQRTDADRLANALAVYSQVAARVLRLTYLTRLQPGRPAAAEFTQQECAVLGAYRRQHLGGADGGPPRTLAEAVRVLAPLGGHLGRKHDGPPGVQVLWRGLRSLRSLHDIALGYQLAHPDPPEDTRNG